MDGHLGGGVQGQVGCMLPDQARKTQVLHNQRVYANPIKCMNHLLRLFQLFFFQNRIDRDINTCMIQMGMLHQCFNIFQ